MTAVKWWQSSNVNKCVSTNLATFSEVGVANHRWWTPRAWVLHYTKHSTCRLVRLGEDAYKANSVIKDIDMVSTNTQHETDRVNINNYTIMDPSSPLPPLMLNRP